jgi:hypothetical protein
MPSVSDAVLHKGQGRTLQSELDEISCAYASPTIVPTTLLNDAWKVHLFSA